MNKRTATKRKTSNGISRQGLVRFADDIDDRLAAPSTLANAVAKMLNDAALKTTPADPQHSAIVVLVHAAERCAMQIASCHEYAGMVAGAAHRR